MGGSWLHHVTISKNRLDQLLNFTTVHTIGRSPHWKLKKFAVYLYPTNLSCIISLILNFVNDYENPMKQFLLKLNMFKLLTYWWSKLFDFLWTFYNCISLLLYLYQLVYHMLNNVPLTDDIWFDNRLKSGLKGQMFVQIIWGKNGLLLLKICESQKLPD